MGKNVSVGSINGKENYVKVVVNSKMYSLDTVYAAGYVFLDKSYIILDQDKNKNIEVYLFPQKEPSDLNKMGLEFCNELLNYAHYFSRAKTNAETTKTIIQRALFSVSPNLAEEAEEQEIQSLIKELEDEEEKEKITKPKRGKKNAVTHSKKKK